MVKKHHAIVLLLSDRRTCKRLGTESSLAAGNVLQVFVCQYLYDHYAKRPHLRVQPQHLRHCTEAYKEIDLLKVLDLERDVDRDWHLNAYGSLLRA